MSWTALQDLTHRPLLYRLKKALFDVILPKDWKFPYHLRVLTDFWSFIANDCTRIQSNEKWLARSSSWVLGEKPTILFSWCWRTDSCLASYFCSENDFEEHHSNQSLREHTFIAFDLCQVLFLVWVRTSLSFGKSKMSFLSVLASMSTFCIGAIWLVCVFY